MLKSLARISADIESKLKALCFLDRRITLEMAAMFFKWRVQWNGMFGNTFYKIYASQNLDIESKSKVLCS